MSMHNDHKLYVIVRRDISPGYQIVQSCHAVADHERTYPERGQKHQDLGNTMVVLEISNEKQLLKLYERMRVLTPTTLFREPDIRDEATAFACTPSPFWPLFRDLKLAGTKQEQAKHYAQDLFDRHARAYGWEIGRGQALAETVQSTDGNPFLDPNWDKYLRGERNK